MIKMENQLLLMSTRLKMPEPRKSYIVRQELFTKLDAIGEYRVILVKGSAGTGKTTLISTFAKEKGLDVKWISLSESCNNVFIFWSYFIEAIGSYLGPDKQDLISLYKANFQKSNMEQLLTLLINGLDLTEDIFIVLDDFYHIQDSFLIHTIDFFINNVSPNVHLIILTRQEPAVYLGALNMEGRLLTIGEQDLKLSREAGGRFLTETLGLNLDTHTLELLNRISEGWIGGLQLVATAVAVQKEKAVDLSKLDNSLVGEYLTREIYGLLNQEEQEFLVVTSIVPYFNQEICSSLVEGMHFKKITASLFKKNILITCVDEEKGIYRYHNILREYLKKRFMELSRDKQLALHQKAAAIFKSLGDYHQCLEQLLLAGDYIAVMKLILDSPENIALFSLAEQIPDQYLVQNPDFTYQSVFYFYANMEIHRCQRLFQVLKEKMEQDPIFSPMKSLYIFIDGGFSLSEITVLPISQVDKLPLQETTKAFILIRDASFLHAQSRYDEALSFIEKTMSYSVSNTNPYIVFFSFGIKSQILEDMGELRKCEGLYKEMDKIMASNKFIGMFNTSYYIGKAGVHLKKMDLTSALDCLRRSEEYVVDQGSPTAIGYKYNLAEYQFLLGEIKKGLELAQDLMNMTTFKNLVAMSSLLYYVFKLNNFTGELVEQYIHDYESLEEGNRSLDSKLLYAIIIFHKGQVQAAFDLVDGLLKHYRMRRVKLKLVQASLAKIDFLLYHEGKKRDITNLFREALYYSCQDKILLPFYLERETVNKAVKLVDPEFYSDLSNNEKDFYQDLINLCKIDTKSILSDRELEVLIEITKGSSNKEIADNLCISLATVKSHVINIYSKLHVNNRVTAIEEARRLRIL